MKRLLRVHLTILRSCAALFFLALALVECGPSAPVAKEPHGVISMAPNHTETIFALGQGSRVIGVSDYCDYPPEVADLPKLGGYLNPDYEKISLLRPTLLIVAGQHKELSDFARLRNIRLLNVHMDSFETIEAGILTIGAALGCDEEAETLRARVRRELDVVRAAVEGLPRPKVLVINNRVNHDLNSLFTVGRGSFMSELVDVAGGENIFGDTKRAYLEASKETIVLRAPEVILEYHAWQDLAEGELERYRDDWKELPMLPAVKSGRIYTEVDTYALRPGPRVALTARKMAKIFHPTVVFPDP